MLKIRFAGASTSIAAGMLNVTGREMLRMAYSTSLSMIIPTVGAG